ncbi:MAG: hypothetical protein K2O11_11660 [Oscillospiraceae bacterium]|nr:hypothetical protein [Oscillospiraceae bacterium]
MKKIASLILALILCASMLAASLQTVCLAAKPDPPPTPTATAEPDLVNGLPADEERENRD